MVDMRISARNPAVNLTRQVSRSNTLATANERPASATESGREIAQPAGLSTLGGFKNALVDFRNALATLAALAKTLAITPPLDPEPTTDIDPDAAAQRAGTAGGSGPAMAGKPPPGTAERAGRQPATPNDGSLLDPNASRSSPRTAAVADTPITHDAATLIQAIRAFVATHNKLVAILHRLTSEASLPPSGDAIPAGAKTSPAGDQPARESLPGGEWEHDPTASGDRAGGTSRLPRNANEAEPGQQARRLLDALATATAKLSGLRDLGVTLDRDGELRLDNGQLRAAVTAQPRAMAAVLEELETATEEVLRRTLPSPVASRSPNPTAATPATLLSAALTEFQEQARALTGLARWLVRQPFPGNDGTSTPSSPIRGSGDAANPAFTGHLPAGKLPADPLLASAAPRAAPGMAGTSPATTASDPSPEIEIHYLSRQETLLSSALQRPNDRLAAVTLHFRAGSPDEAQRFLADPRQPSASVTLGEGDDTLPGLRDAINSSGLGLGATVIKDNAGHRLAMRLSAETHGASMEVTVEKASGSTTDTGQPLRWIVQRDTDAVRHAVQSFVGAYNRLNGVLDSLSGEPRAQALGEQLRGMLADGVVHPDRARVLAQAGITLQRDGSLLLDPIRLQAMATAHPQRVLELFADFDAEPENETGETSGRSGPFTELLSEIRDGKEPRDPRLDDLHQPAVDRDGGHAATPWLDAAEARYRARFETVDRVARHLLATEAWLKQALGRLLDGGS